MDPDVYRQTEAFKRGWVKGFYDCGRDEGTRDGARSCLSDDERAGYAAGLQARLRRSRPATAQPSGRRRHRRAA